MYSAHPVNTVLSTSIQNTVVQWIELIWKRCGSRRRPLNIQSSWICGAPGWRPVGHPFYQGVLLYYFIKRIVRVWSTFCKCSTLYILCKLYSVNTMHTVFRALFGHFVDSTNANCTYSLFTQCTLCSVWLVRKIYTLNPKNFDIYLIYGS